jgi:protoporphyrinogen oxidase
VGAGVAGMFTAMLFDYVNEKYNLGVQYEILEAEPTRYGGRLYTYNFPQKGQQPPPGPHDYYDVGAMRFPETLLMTR